MTGNFSTASNKAGDQSISSTCHVQKLFTQLCWTAQSRCNMLHHNQPWTLLASKDNEMDWLKSFTIQTTRHLKEYACRKHQNQQDKWTWLPEFTPNSPFSGHEPPLKSIWPCAGQEKGPSDRWPWKSGCWSFHPPNITATRRPFRHPANPHLLQPRGLISLVHHRRRGFAKTSPLCSSICRPCPWVLAHLLPNVFAHLLLPSVLAHLLLPSVLAHLLFVVPLPTFFFLVSLPTFFLVSLPTFFFLVSLPTFFFLVSLPTFFLVSLPTFFVLAHRVPEKYSSVWYFLKEAKPEAGKYHAKFFTLLLQCSLSLNWHDDSVRAKPPNSLDITAVSGSETSWSSWHPWQAGKAASYSCRDNPHKDIR